MLNFYRNTKSYTPCPAYLQRFYTAGQMFKNADGSKTAYYYNYPVKYTDENGKVKDITLDITSSTKTAGAFESKDSTGHHLRQARRFGHL